MLNFDSIVFGPIYSRRLHSSLGINLLPAGSKLCNFDCIYCECGWNADSPARGVFPAADDVKMAMEQRFRSLYRDKVHVDSITFSGNGEPTLHPQFPEITDFTLELRDLWLPSAKVSVLSNATTLLKDDVFQALRKVDMPILKLDAPSDGMALLINRPSGHYRIDEIVERMRALNGNFILQTMFMHGAALDYASDAKALEGWMDIVRDIRPGRIMVYTVDRDTPDKGLSKMSVGDMTRLLRPLLDEGFDIQING